MSGFMADALREFRKNKGLADKAMAQVSDEQFFHANGAEDNSMAVIVKHVAGNLRSRWTDFLASDGEKQSRDRDGEFIIGSADSRSALLAAWETGWQILFMELEPLGDVDLDRTVTIRGEPLTVQQAVTRQVSHYAYHVGQIVLLAKHHAWTHWKSLSIPKGKSKEFNAAPRNYL